MMNREERKQVLALLDRLLSSWENDFDCIMCEMKQEAIEHDFFEDLYDILYEFSFNEKKLLARVWKLLDQKTIQSADKNNQNRYN